jgi:predicted ribosomally synthesized peptide with SipW-like signal peptide
MKDELASRNFLRAVASLVLGLISTSTWAAWSAPVQITGYFVYEGGDAYFTTTNNQTAKAAKTIAISL